MVMTRQRQFLLAAIVIAITAGGIVRKMSQPPALTDAPETSRGLPAISHKARAATDNAVALIDGFVRDDIGAPVVGARVCVNLSSLELPSDVTRDPQCTTSDARGGYRIIPMLPSEMQLGAMAKDHEPAVYTSPAGLFFTMKPGEHRHIDLVARRGGVEVSGVVSDIGGGPIASARVHAGGLMVDTDDQGRYTLWLSRSWQMVFAGAHGYVTQTRTGTPPVHFDFTLEPSATLSGTIVDASGQPVEGVRVLVAPTDTSEYRDTANEVGFTDDRGRFSIDRLSPGHYIATASAAHGYGTSETTLVGVGRVAETTVTLAPAYQVIGHLVTGAARTPCINSYVSLHDAVRGTTVPVIVEPDGTLRADGVLPGTYYPVGSCGNALSQRRQDPVHVVDRDVEAVWRVAESGTLRGHIRDKQGRPVARADIRATQIDAAPRAEAGGGAVTATPEGEYVISNLLPGRYRVVASAAGRCCGPGVDTELSVDVTADGLEKDLVVLDDGARVHGVVTSHGRPVPRVTVKIDSEHSTVSLDTDDHGAFEIEGVAPAHYTLEVSNRAGALPVVSGPHDIEVAASASIDVALDIELKTGAIRGRVVDVGHPAADAFVTFALEHDDQPGRSSYDREVLVAADGTFVANDLAAGTYSIRARRKGASEVMKRHVAIGASVVLELPPVGAIAIAARRDGAPVDDVSVSLTRLDDTMQERYEQRTGVHGEIALRDVSPGRYAVSVASHDAHGRMEVTVLAGDTVSVAFDLEPRVTLVGRVVDARSGRPVPQTSIVVTAETGAMVGLMATNTYITDAAGRFAVEHVPRGSVTVTTQLPDASMQSVSTYRTIPHGGPTGEVIDLGELRVAPVPANRGFLGCGLSIAEFPRAPVIVSSVAPEGPAARAGLVVGDIVTAVDGIDVTGDHNNEASVLLDGSEGAKIELTLQRGVTATIVLE